MRALIGLAGTLILAVLAVEAEELSFDGPNAFRLPWEGLNTSERARFNYGRSLFHYHWDPLPSASGGQRGLGPLFNADSCESCHIRDGRGLPPGATEGLGGLVLVLVTPEAERAASRVLHPRYGRQVQDQAVAPALPELGVRTEWHSAAVPGDSGAGQVLRRPVFILTDPVDGETDIVVAPRLAPPMIGLGRLASIPEADIIAASDPSDDNGDGISGRANWLQDADTPERRLGRFGWKASVATVRDQARLAASFDMGLTIPGAGHPAGDCTDQQAACIAQAGDLIAVADFDMDENSFGLLAFYAENLAVPPRRIDDADITAAGEHLFTTAGCASCHTPVQVTETGESIAPYTDLLLHDMGEGLADGYSIGTATGQEWRTPPLWGIGRTEQVSGGTFLLHDGRARGLEEAILWHGGEAADAQRNFREMSPDDRNALLTFLASL